MPEGRLLVSIAAAAAAACGGSGSVARAAPVRAADIECNSRRAEYMVVGGMVAPESGVSLVCERSRPRITSWRTEAGRAEQIRSSRALTAEQFEAAWEKIDATGWRFLSRTCPARKRARSGKRRRAPRAPREPIYTIDVGDSASSVSLTCTGAELPFPYDRLVNELDLRAAGFGDDAGSPH